MSTFKNKNSLRTIEDETDFLNKLRRMRLVQNLLVLIKKKKKLKKACISLSPWLIQCTRSKRGF